MDYSGARKNLGNSSAFKMVHKSYLITAQTISVLSSCREQIKDIRNTSFHSVYSDITVIDSAKLLKTAWSMTTI